MYNIELKFYNELVELAGFKIKKLIIKEKTTVKDIVESVGIPHTEFGDTRINGKNFGADQLVCYDCLIEVYPKIEPRETPGGPKFILDVHLGTLSKYLRFLGFDTLYENSYLDQEIVDIGNAEKRVILTMDRGILKRKEVVFGYLIRGKNPLEQLEDVVRVYGLKGKENLFSRCSVCNGKVAPVKKSEISHKLLPKTREYFDNFYICKSCGRIYWMGSHYERLEKTIKKIING